MLKLVDCQKTVFIEPTEGVKKIIPPNITPFDVINLAAKRSTTYANLANYLFFENFLGYNFRSLSSLYDEPVVQIYDTHIAGAHDHHTDIDSAGNITTRNGMEKQFEMIIGHEMVDGNDTIFNHTTGVYGSKHIIHDIITKSFKTKVYNYFDNFSNERHIGDNPIFSETSIDTRGRRVSDFPARTFLTSSNGFQGAELQHQGYSGGYGFTIDDPSKLLERTSSLNQLNRGIIINLAVVGSTHIKAGDIIEVNIPLTAAYKTPQAEDGSNDRFYSGKFLIKKLYHSFDFGERKHKTILTCVKDSLEKPLENCEGQTEPKPNRPLHQQFVNLLV